MLYIREDIPSYLELNLRNEKYLINFSYNPQKTMISTHLVALEKFLNMHFSNYEKVLILGDFNVWVNEQNMQSFCETYDLKSMTKQHTCYKNLNSPTCIYLILTNVPRSFQSTFVVKTGLLDFHLMTLTVMRKSFQKIR